MADNTYTFGTDSARRARPDLAEVAARWLTEYGLGPDSRYVALKATGRVDVETAGEIRLDGEGLYRNPDLANRSYKRPVGQAFAHAAPADMEAYDADPIDYGQPAAWDTNDHLTRGLLNRGGIAAVEAKFTAQSLNVMLQGADIDFLTPLGAATGPFSADDVDASTSQWTDPATDIPAQLGEGEQNLDGNVNAVVLDFKAYTLFKHHPSLVSRWGGNQGFGSLNDQQARDAFASYGITNVFVCHSQSPLGSKVILYKYSNDPIVAPCGLIRPVMIQEAMDSFGIQYFTGELDERRGYALGVTTCDFIYVDNAGVRIVDVYT